MQVYNVGPVEVQFERNGHFIPVELEFSFSIPFHYLVPTTTEESERFHRNTTRLIRFFQGLNRAFVIETDYEETELFATGRIKNVSVEVPSKCNKMPIVGALFYHKAQALLEEIALEEFTMTFTLTEGSLAKHEGLKSQLVYNDMTYLGSNLEALVEIHEQEWMTDIIENYFDTEEEMSEEEQKQYKPWWKRSTGDVRDMVNIIIHEIEDEDTGELLEGVPLRTKEELMAAIQIPKISLGDDDEFAETIPSKPPTEPDGDGTDDTNNYLNF